MFKLALLASLVLTTSASADRRDGSHDFDFELGTWRIKVKKLEHPLSRQQKWLDYTGTSTTRPLWNGKAQIVELEIDSPTAGHLEGMVVRLYSPASHQWSLNWSNAKNAHFDVPTVGEFRGGRGELYDMEEFDGRMILVRAAWSNITKT
jgi:hypothetical protein